MSGSRRKSWRHRVCDCGNRVETRWQLDITVCSSSKCMDRVFLHLGYVPSPAHIAKRHTLPTPRTGDPSVAPGPAQLAETSAPGIAQQGGASFLCAVCWEPEPHEHLPEGK